MRLENLLRGGGSFSSRSGNGICTVLAKTVTNLPTNQLPLNTYNANKLLPIPLHTYLHTYMLKKPPIKLITYPSLTSLLSNANASRQGGKKKKKRKRETNPGNSFSPSILDIIPLRTDICELLRQHRRTNTVLLRRERAGRVEGYFYYCCYYGTTVHTCVYVCT